ncbi:23S rRNA (adenine(2030)-N(6))-methyltransferase RlmJ [Limibaculum sp. FT325]|uniref:23S rRNA (adenine(2030)-N(6))-methyltransferase RlmJ n=1 Tax=Thermohalobaculum sediminis TaxID=2939436 RepID=UPI0020C0C6F2|nr:23S rRNA (adenine(2030)-N(6))-methyltransferase RlmJ [Limibaculum sediminis]MCL5777421.1 23S rRNA (adenine(2030)-N(6))-methyltransferase RlmJ [Limibaculum sediminis]
MLSYQHAYHAGNAADLHKHMALAALLDLLTAKPRAISYMESHAGRGLYDLGAPEALKTGEAAAGIGRLTPGKGPFWRALDAARARFGPAAYPGSPLIARLLTRPQDRLILCELHPAENAALREAMAGEGVAIHRRDGHEGLPALAPPRPRRGLALIDPSYEVKDEYARSAETALALLRRWPEGIVMVWYPILPAGRHVELTGPVEAARLPGFLRHEVGFTARPERGMTGSGLLFANLPFGAADALRSAWAEAATVFHA